MILPCYNNAMTRLFREIYGYTERIFGSNLQHRFVGQIETMIAINLGE